MLTLAAFAIDIANGGRALKARLEKQESEIDPVKAMMIIESRVQFSVKAAGGALKNGKDILASLPWDDIAAAADVDWSRWQRVLQAVHNPKHEVTIGLVGKYIDIYEMADGRIQARAKGVVSLPL